MKNGQKWFSYCSMVFFSQYLVMNMFSTCWSILKQFSFAVMLLRNWLNCHLTRISYILFCLKKLQTKKYIREFFDPIHSITDLYHSHKFIDLIGMHSANILTALGTERHTHSSTVNGPNAQIGPRIFFLIFHSLKPRHLADSSSSRCQE